MGPDSVKKLTKKGFQFAIEKAAGSSAHFPDDQYLSLSGVALHDRGTVLKTADILARIGRPAEADFPHIKPGALLICLAEPYLNDNFFEKLSQRKINCLALELIPRTSRAQSMDVLSSQANIAGYRAVIEAAHHFSRYFPVMMTSAGMAKAAKVAVLGVGVAGLQAIATARRLGASVEAFDVRPEVKEQILSLGAKYMDLNIGESASGSGGYAKELSEEGKKKQQEALTQRLKGFDIIISTANIPGRKAPVLITEEAVRGMRPGSVIVDLAAANGGNCPLTVAQQVSVAHGVTLIGFTNFAEMLTTDASQFFGNNLANLIDILYKDKERETLNLEDDIVQASLAVFNGEIRFKRPT